jgi:hypothetical protein
MPTCPSPVTRAIAASFVVKCGAHLICLSSLSLWERAGGEGLYSLAHPLKPLTLTLSQRERGEEHMPKNVP